MPYRGGKTFFGYMDRERIKKEFLDRCAGWTKEDGLVRCYNSDLILLFGIYAKNLRDDFLSKPDNVVVRYYGRTNSNWSGMFRDKDGKYFVDLNPYPLMRMQRGKIPFADIDETRVYNTLDAALLVFEHELTHLIEKMKYGRTAHGARFKKLSAYYFGHDPSAAVGHTLPTKSNSMRNVDGDEFAKGDRVCFQHSGIILEGIITRITKRASVKVSTPGKFNGVLFYVPTAMLQKAKEENRSCPRSPYVK